MGGKLTLAIRSTRVETDCKAQLPRSSPCIPERVSEPTGISRASQVAAAVFKARLILKQGTRHTRVFRFELSGKRQ